MCCESYESQSKLYQEEIFQPLHLLAESLEGNKCGEDGEEPINDKHSQRGVEMVGESMNPVKAAIGEDGENSHRCEPL